MPEGNNSGGGNNRPDGDSNDKFEDQVELILAEFGDEIEIDPPNWRTAGVNAIYRSRGVLVRDHDAPRAVDLFGGGNARRSSLGVTRLDLPDAVPADAPDGDGFTSGPTSPGACRQTVRPRPCHAGTPVLRL